MLRPRMTHPNLQLTDITQQFHDSATALPPGEVVKDGDFSLFEAVGALEIGDPKMDSGFLEEGEALEDDFDFEKPLTAAQIIWLMDELTCREVAWHRGYPLSQTLFTSVHLDKLLWPEPKQLCDARFIRQSPSETASYIDLLQEAFRAYCLGLIKCCDLVHQLVTRQHYYEEEDFATQLFNRELLHAFHPEDILAHLTYAWKDLAEADEGASDEKSRHAILERLNLRMVMLKTFMSCLDNLRPSEIIVCLMEIDAVNSSSALAEPLPEVFSIKIQRRLASSVPPRPMVVVERSESIEFLHKMFTDIESALEMFDISHSSDLYTAYRIFMNQQEEPSVYVRCLLQSFLSINDHVLATQSPKNFAIEDIKSLVLPASVLLDPANEIVENPSDPRFQITSSMTDFLSKGFPPFINQYRSFCQNRCRFRRLLCHAVIELDGLQADAEEIDVSLQDLIHEKPLPYPVGEPLTYAYPLSSWVYHYKLMQLQLVVHTGFELSVYVTHEYAGMYWYLSHLTSLHLSHLERISYFVSSYASPQSTQAKAELQDALALLYRHFTRLKATDTLASALHRLYIFLQRHGHCAKVKPAYSSDQLRFDLRMRPFQGLSIPEPLSYEEMSSLTDLKSVSDKELLEQAGTLAGLAKKGWEEVLKGNWNFKPLSTRAGTDGGKGGVIEREWKADVRNCMKACIATSIAVGGFMKVLSGDNRKRVEGMKVSIPEPESKERFHRWWAVPKVQT